MATLTLIMTGPMGADAGPVWARAPAGQDPDPADLPPPAPRFLDFLARSAAMPRTTREEFVAVNVELWRMLNGDVLPFDERATRRLSEETLDGSADPAAALNHDLAGRVMTSDRLVSAVLDHRAHAGRSRHGGPAAPAPAWRGRGRPDPARAHGGDSRHGGIRSCHRAFLAGSASSSWRIPNGARPK
ncbi:hypothetical protein [Nonomuraea sp. NPDC050202]|uniref:hypothetical protein n=1 Tax=Nonomuraea sp. NPDC050202 TaxID=3155035 RepID=UPI0033C87870